MLKPAPSQLLLHTAWMPSSKPRSAGEGQASQPCASPEPSYQSSPQCVPARISLQKVSALRPFSSKVQPSPWQSRMKSQHPRSWPPARRSICLRASRAHIRRNRWCGVRNARSHVAGDSFEVTPGEDGSCGGGGDGGGGLGSDGVDGGHGVSGGCGGCCGG
eukprot:1151211-Prymnesium_polylepis.1